MAYTAESYDRALALLQQGRPHEAEQLCQQIVAAEPTNAAAWQLFGVAAHSRGGREEAVAYLCRAVELKPDFAEAHSNFGVALKTAGRVDEAIQAYHRALALRPDDAATWNNLGDALQSRAEFDEAIAAYQQALKLRPNYGEAYNNLGNTYRQLLKYDEALACYQRALAASGDFPEAYNNAGTVYQQQGRLEEAAAAYRRALELNPNYADGHNNLAIIYKEFGQLDQAEACYLQALRLRPAYAEAHCNLSSIRLARGDFASGLAEYEWRWKAGVLPVPDFPQPRWQGEPLAGKTLLLVAEQGLGDTIQFIRFAAVLKERGAKIIFQCQKPLVRLLSSYRAVDQLIAAGDAPPRFDFWTPLLSVPLYLGLTMETIPADVPYLFAEPALVAEWRERLNSEFRIQNSEKSSSADPNSASCILPSEFATRPFVVGINWQGRLGSRESLQRDVPRELFESLAEIPGVRLVSLQKSRGDSARQKEPHDLAVGTTGPAILELGDFDTDHGAFVDSAAIMMNLDLVISSDTSVPHLAGALGVPVWLLIPFTHDWRWFLNRSDSPWYPTMRLFRQQKSGDWASVFDDIRAALRRSMAVGSRESGVGSSRWEAAQRHKPQE